MKKVYLVEGKRTPFGKFGGSLQSVTPIELSVLSAKALIESIKLSPEKIEHVIYANVLPTTPDTQYGGRHIGLKLGCSIQTPAYTVNRLCGSGIEAIVQAKRLIQHENHDCVLVSGSENMSMAPHLVYGSRFGTKYGNLKTADLLLDTLTDSHTNTPMGITAENLAEQYNISRDDCEKFAMNSHLKSSKANSEGLLKDEIFPMQLKKGSIDKDEHIRPDISLAEMQKLRTSFKTDGTVTPATASGIVDGSASVIIASEDFVKKNNLTPLCEVIDSSVIGVEPTCMGIGPAPAINLLLEKVKLKLEEIDLVEINEAFAAQALACAKELGLNLDKLNVWGGATAIGHPLGATGVRITHTLARQLKHFNKQWGIASACIGGGQGIAILLKR